MSESVSYICRRGDHEDCGGMALATAGYGPCIKQSVDCACPCHARETAGIDMKEAFAR